MGAKLLKFYDFVNKEGGATAAMRLAMKTSIPSKKAESEPDSAENIAKFKAAVKEIVGKDAPIA